MKTHCISQSMHGEYLLQFEKMGHKLGSSENKDCYNWKVKRFKNSQISRLQMVVKVLIMLAWLTNLSSALSVHVKRNTDDIFYKYFNWSQ